MLARLSQLSPSSPTFEVFSYNSLLHVQHWLKEGTWPLSASVSYQASMRKGVQLVLKILYSCGKQTYRGRCTWKAEDSVGESVLSLLHVSPGNGGSLGLGTSTFPPEPSPWLEDLSTVWCLPSLLHMCSHVTHLHTPPTCMHFFIVFIHSVSAHTWCVCAHTCVHACTRQGLGR